MARTHPTHLTHREDEVRHLAIAGLSNDEIAARLAISRRTVEAHLRTLFRKTGVTRRSQLALLYDGEDPEPGRAAEPAGPAAPGLVKGGLVEGGLVEGQTGPPARHGGAARDCERRLRDHAAAVRGLVDRQFPLFEERVEITVLVGERDGQDIVVERRWTTPRPYLVYRILCPIVAWPEGLFEVDDIVTSKVDGQDIQMDVHALRDTDGRPLVMILFQPGLQKETAWELRYRSPQLWDPLRRRGRDTLTWATATLDQRHKPTINDLTLKVVFPPGWTGQQVAEQNDLGEAHTEWLSTGQTQVTWRQGAPGAGSYHWTLRGSPGAGRSR